MAQFKIYLLTPSVVDVNEENSFNQRTSYLKTTISEFYSQQEEFNNGVKDLKNQKNTFTFTFDEKIAFHKNAQKELTFSMLRNIWIENEFVVNPFISALSIGTQVLLEDKDENEHIFTIKNISYTPTSENMLYAYTCQDSFSYQGARQNSGYTIDNDSSSADFIGAENIDFWANRIKTDCHIGYDYLGLEDILWLASNNNLYLSKNIKQTIEEENEIRKEENKEPISFNKYIKKSYNEKEHKDYFATIPFSVSGSNASAALISLAEQLGLMLRVYEKSYKNTEDDRVYIKTYFWLEPEKHEEVSGLKYSPYSSIQSFSFSHAGESLSTVLNVESNTFDDELITLLPDVPEFFVEYFDSKEWDESSFYSGFFTSLCTGKVFKSKDTDGSDFTIEDSCFKGGGILELKLSKFEIPDFYKNYRFNIDSDESELYLNTERQTPYISKWVLGYYNKNSEWVELKKEGGITGDVLKENPNLYIRINHTLENAKDDPDIAHVNLTINFYRDATQEELDFAAIADKCPWLENKLIDFSYFLENKIINKSEYNRLQSIVKDSLRRVNGRLLSYTKDFYQATKDKIETISNLTNDIDSVGAAFQADVLDSYADCGNVEDISYFRAAYSKWASSKDENKKTELLHLNNLLADYANKYFKTQQRFLKNIYNFKNYFEAPVIWNGKNTEIYEKELTLDLSGEQFVFFSNSAFEKWTNNTNAITIGSDGKANKTLFKKDLKTEFEYVHSDNFSNYKYSDEDPNKFISSDEYNSNRQYYRHAIKIKIEDGIIPQTKEDYGHIFYYYYHEGDYAYYILPGYPNLTKVTDEYVEVPVTKSDMTREWLYNLYNSNRNNFNNLYWKGDIAYIDNFLTDAEILQISKWIDIGGDFSSFVDLIVEANYEIDPLLWISVYTSPGDSAEKKFKKTYQETFPIDNLYIKHKSFKWSADDEKWEETSENDVFYELPFVKKGNYTSYYCQTAVVTWPWKDNIRWRTGGGLCTHCWDDSYLGSETGFVSKSKTVYAPTSTSRKEYDALASKTKETLSSVRHYENYYKFVADTYKSARNNNEKWTTNGIYKKYYYRSKMLKVINSSNKINKYSTYKIIPIDNSDGCVKQGFINTVLTKDINEFSAVTYFPIVALSSEIDLTSYDWKAKQEECSVNEILKAFIPNSGTWNYNSTNKTWSDSNTTLLVLVEQDYTEQYFNSDENKVWESLETFAQKDLYDQNHLLFKPENQDDYATNFLFKKELKETLKDFKESDNTITFNQSRAYYTKDGVRVYTAAQLQKEGIAYYLKDSDTIKFTSYGEGDNSFSTQVNIYDNGIIKNLGYMTLTPTQEEDDHEQLYLAISVTDKDTGKKYVSFIEKGTINSKLLKDLKNYTNAQLWSEFHSQTDSPLFEDAARIETQLEEYWLQAYNASKYCEYFLPEHWQPSTDGKRNCFSELVFNPDNLQLSSKIIPNVIVVKEQNTTLLPKYNFTIKAAENDESLPSLCSQNKAIKNAFDTLGIADSEDWAGQPLNLNTTYYAAESGTGMKWVEVLGRLVPGSEQAFSKFNGIYPMTFRFLKNNFIQKELINYEAALAEHNKIWDNLYKFFPGLILETSYSNPDATTSQDLFTLATNYFRDLSRPERGYNISIIDAAKLLGYKGQELHIGDSIQVDAEEFYDEYDDVKKTLSQHLFITDISYDLRKDTDIQLTVNSIKYQDKLIQRLAKLIIK